MAEPGHRTAGQIQTALDPRLLLPSRPDLLRRRLELQRQLLVGGIQRATPIRVTLAGVIFDGHHAVRAAAEEGRLVDAKIVDEPTQSVGLWILWTCL